VSIKQPYHPIAIEKMNTIKKHENKINQEARKEIVLRKVINPKVSEIQNKNEQYVQQKTAKKFLD
jgi:hypothetical protein